VLGSVPARNSPEIAPIGASVAAIFTPVKSTQRVGQASRRISWSLVARLTAKSSSSPVGRDQPRVVPATTGKNEIMNEMAVTLARFAPNQITKLE